MGVVASALLDTCLMKAMGCNIRFDPIATTKSVV
jgi:hypothetical protein